MLIYDNTARSSGVFLKCKKCGSEVEIKIKNK
nr:MAG TPA: cysteine-rich protein [Caudoviricetes sp.]